MRFTLCLIAALTASLAARAETLGLRCTITAKGQKAYSGYVWIDMPTRRALEQWFPDGQRGPVTGPFHVVVYPNEVSVADSAAANGVVRIRIDRTSGAGTVSGGTIQCDSSDVPAPPFPALPAAHPPAKAPAAKH